MVFLAAAMLTLLGSAQYRGSLTALYRGACTLSNPAVGFGRHVKEEVSPSQPELSVSAVFCTGSVVLTERSQRPSFPMPPIRPEFGQLQRRRIPPPSQDDPYLA
jgi:hypothetical protein